MDCISDIKPRLVTSKHTWPHQGAKNSTSDGVPSKISLSKLLGVRSRTLDADAVERRTANAERASFLNIISDGPVYLSRFLVVQENHQRRLLSGNIK